MFLKRFLVATVVAIIVLFVVVPAMAQEPLELDATYEDPEGNFSFNYPSAWSTSFNQFDAGYLRLDASVRNDDGYNIRLSGLLHKDQTDFVALRTADDDLLSLLPLVLEQFSMDEHEDIREPETMMLGDYPYAEIIASNLDSNGERLFESAGVLDLGNDYYAYIRATRFGTETIEDFLADHITGREVLASFQMNNDSIPPIVPFEFDPAGPTNTDILDDSELVQTFVNEDGDAPSLRTPAGYDGYVYSTDFTLDGPSRGDLYGPYIYGVFLEEGEDYDYSFTDAADFLEQQTLDVPGPTVVTFDFLTGINSFEFDNGNYADVIYSVQRPASDPFYVIDTILVLNDGRVLSMGADVDSEYVNNDVDEVFAIAAELRAIMRSFSVEAAEATGDIDTSNLSSDPRAISDEAVLNDVFILEAEDVTITVRHPAEWSANSFADDQLELYSNADVFGLNEDSFSLSLFLLPEQAYPMLGIEAGMNSAEAAQASREFIDSDPDLGFDVLSDVEVFEFDSFNYAEFVYGFTEDEYYYLDSVGFIVLGEDVYGVSGSLRTINGVEELPAFYQAQSIARAIIATMEIEPVE